MPLLLLTEKSCPPLTIGVANRLRLRVEGARRRPWNNPRYRPQRGPHMFSRVFRKFRKTLKNSGPAARRSRWNRPAVELLEDRLVPTCSADYAAFQGDLQNFIGTAKDALQTVVDAAGVKI